MDATARILALDQGTSSSRAIVFDGAGQPLGEGRCRVTALYPRPGWVEQDPEEIWDSVAQAAALALRAAGVRAGEIAAVGVANQRETALMWDRRTARPVYRAIVWQDRRTAAQCAELAAGGWSAAVRQRTGLLLDPYFSATKFGWMLRHAPEAADLAAAGRLACGTVDSWLAWRLSGGRLHVTDVTNASRTMLFDIHRMCWDGELADRFGIPLAALPEVRPSAEVLGATDPAVFGAAVPLAALVGDQQAALFGQGAALPGAVKCTYGTGCFLLAACGARAPDPVPGLLTTVAAAAGGTVDYALEGSVFAAGAAVDWLRDIGVLAAAPDVEPLAASVADTGGVCFVPAFAGLGAPQWDPSARGALLGLTRGTTAAHLARAALEAIAQQCADVLDLMLPALPVRPAELRVDGGMAKNGLLMQLQADRCGIAVARPAVTETTALGAALLAGLAVGIWRDRAQIAAAWRAERRFAPSGDTDRRRREQEVWAAAVRRAMGWAAGPAGDDGPARPLPVGPDVPEA